MDTELIFMGKMLEALGHPQRDQLYGELGLEKRGQPLPRLRRLVQMLLMLLGIDFGFELLLALPCISPATLSTSVGYTPITDTG